MKYIQMVMISALVCLCFQNSSYAQDSLVNQNGWFVQDHKAIWGWVQHNGWWRPGQRPNITRRSVNDPDGDIRPNRTEDLDALTDSMLRYGYPGFEHNFGLWYDRRRDAHDTEHRDNPDVVPPFLEQPWVRTVQGMAADGLPLYDLTEFNPWYFQRIKEFADLCDRKGTVLFHKFYMQHALLETQTHYVDFPWRPANTIQETGMPDTIPAANAFYDISDPTRRMLHRLYIRKCLDTLKDNRNVVHLISQEFTGPAHFVEFWLETIAEWKRENDREVVVGLTATKDVQDVILENSDLVSHINVLDLRNWWVKDDGELFAPAGGIEYPGRNIEVGYLQAEETSPERIYQKIRRYRDLYPNKAIIDAIEASRQQSWAFLMAGGGLLVRGQISYPGYEDPLEYIMPADMDIILPTYQFIRENIHDLLPYTTPADLATDRDDVWCLAANDRAVLAYSLNGGTFRLDLSGLEGSVNCFWFDPRTGEMTQIEPGSDQAGDTEIFSAPNNEDWALLVLKE